MKRRGGRGGQSMTVMAAGVDADHRVDLAAKVKKMKNRVKFERRLVKYEALPDYLQDNEFIRDYYRCEWPLKDLVLSVFSLHNETLNIWTHLGGAMIFVALTVMSLTEKASLENLLVASNFLRWEATSVKHNNSAAAFRESYPRKFPESSILYNVINNNGANSVMIPTWPWFIFLGGATCCLVVSSVSHLFACHSRRCSLLFWRLDHSGISLMITTSFIAPTYYIFSCHPVWRLFYFTSITVLATLAAITLLSPALSSGRFRSFKATIFVTLGLFGIVPAVHTALLYGHHRQVAVALGCEIAMGVLYAVGAGFYVARIPERLRPGGFDLVGSSHQIFHVFVVAAALAHCVATLVVMDWRRGLPLCSL
ncbi:unnamed protein product [Cuscuta epithymum]|uniref:Uncharacterized protein n=1 Tax=Cuscuta epithymum TaxID=186058 RepID=A0AAV0CYE4_9ASTE|nr:unnamed protein product [Cuscuta epithymum]